MSTSSSIRGITPCRAQLLPQPHATASIYTFYRTRFGLGFCGLAIPQERGALRLEGVEYEDVEEVPDRVVAHIVHGHRAVAQVKAL